MQYTVILSPEESGYSVFCPAMGVASQGDTRDDAIRMVREAMDLWWEWATAEGIQPSAESLDFLTTSIRQVLADRAEEGQAPTIETIQVVYEPRMVAA